MKVDLTKAHYIGGLLAGILGIMASVIGMFGLVPYPVEPTWGVVFFLSVGIVTLASDYWTTPKTNQSETE